MISQDVTSSSVSRYEANVQVVSSNSTQAMGRLNDNLLGSTVTQTSSTGSTSTEGNVNVTAGVGSLLGTEGTSSTRNSYVRETNINLDDPKAAASHVTDGSVAGNITDYAHNWTMQTSNAFNGQLPGTAEGAVSGYGLSYADAQNFYATMDGTKNSLTFNPSVNGSGQSYMPAEFTDGTLLSQINKNNQDTIANLIKQNQENQAGKGSVDAPESGFRLAVMPDYSRGDMHTMGNADRTGIQASLSDAASKYTQSFSDSINSYFQKMSENKTTASTGITASASAYSNDLSSFLSLSNNQNKTYLSNLMSNYSFSTDGLKNDNPAGLSQVGSAAQVTAKSTQELVAKYNNLLTDGVMSQDELAQFCERAIANRGITYPA